MYKPYPSPSLLLPAIDLSGSPNMDHILAYKQAEAKWKRIVSETHKTWCLCGSYRNHFISASAPLEKCTESKEDSQDGGDQQENGGTGGDITDEELIAAGGIEE